jgi:hypothetical protein
MSCQSNEHDASGLPEEEPLDAEELESPQVVSMIPKLQESALGTPQDFCRPIGKTDILTESVVETPDENLSATTPSLQPRRSARIRGHTALISNDGNPQLYQEALGRISCHTKKP